MNSEINLIGTWNYRSFLILPAEGKKKAINGDAVAIKQWAVGTLEILSSTEHEFSGELTMVPPIKISVKGKFLTALDGVPAGFEAIGAGEGMATGAVYKLTGWIDPDSADPSKPISIEGAIVAVHGSTAKPEKELGGEPIGTVGAFVLAPVSPQ